MNIEAKNRLSECGIRPSLHRIAIMEYLMKNLIHPTADTVYNNLYQVIPTLSKTTVYNTLKLFEEHGAVQAIVIDDKNVRYDADLSHHAHFRCKSCGAVHDLRFSDREADTVAVENPDNLFLDECHVYFRGFCAECGKSYKF
jgi:Fur family ferric uptake transcriptional regulator/Fur family peroxide stress response transcriptional regulator